MLKYASNTRSTFRNASTKHSVARARQLSWWHSVDVANSSVNALVYAESGMPQSTDVGLPLHNVSVAVKDNICTSTMPTTCSSAMLQNFTSPFDATVVTLMRQAGAAIIGKTNCDEFGMGSLNTYSVHGPVINPFQAPHSTVSWVDRERRSAGGSSGGSAAAVAADMCDVALGTDTGGSTRLPASYCGIVGFKPSYGLISRWGVVSYADSLDCVGIMARAVDDVEKVFDVLVEYDPKDPTAVRPATRRKASQVCDEHYKHLNLGDSLVGLRIGIPQEYFPAELNTSVLGPLRQVLAHLQSRGAQLVPVSLPSTPYALSAYYVISSAEASSNMARYDGIQYGFRVDPPSEADKTKTANVYAHSRSAGFGKEVQKRILLGTYALTADAFDNYFLQAQRVRKLIRQDFDRAFRVPNVLSSQPGSPSSASQAESDSVHVLIHPSAIRTAPPLPAPGSATDGEGVNLDAYVQDVLTVPASLAGLPALGVPAGFGEDGWPAGMSIVGQWGCDKMVLDIGRLCAECAA